MEEPQSTEEWIPFVLKQDDAGRSIANVCGQMGISEAINYVRLE